MSYIKNLIRRYTPPYSKLPGYVETSDPVWYDPSSGIVAVGEYDEWHPDWSNWYWDLKAQAQAKVNALKAGSVQDEIGLELAGVNPQKYGSALEYLSEKRKAMSQGRLNLNKALKSAAILKREDFVGFKTILPQTKIIASKPRKHYLLDLINVEANGEFTTKIYTFDGPFDVVQENLPEMNVPDITGFPNWTPQTIGMERYGIHYAFSEEFLTETFDFNIKQAVLDNVTGQMELVFNKKFADQLNSVPTFTTYASWAARTGNQSDRDPMFDIYAESKKIFDTERDNSMVLASTREVFNAYINSTYNTNLGTPNFKSPIFSLGNDIAGGIPRFNNLQWGIDSFLAAGKFVAFDPTAFYAAQMPERIVDYKSPYGTHQGTIIRKNFIVRPIDSTRILGGTAVLP